MRQILRRFAVLGSTSLFMQLVAFAALAIVARRVDPSYIGSYTVALSIVTFISLPQSLGLTIVGTRDVARDPDAVRTIAGEVFVVQIVIAVVGYAVVSVLAPVIAPNAAMRSLFPILGLFLFTGTSFEWTLQALGEMRSIAIARIAGQVLYGALVPVLVGHGLRGVETFAWLTLLGLALKHVLTVGFLVRAVGAPDCKIGWQRLRQRVSKSMAMGYASVVGQLYSTIDQIMLGYFSTAFDAGEYAVANRIPGAIGTFSGSWIAVVFPHSAHLGRVDKPRLRKEAGRLLSVVALFAIPLAACTPFVAHGLIVAAFGGQYGPASTAFIILTVSLAVGLVDGTLLTLLMGLGSDRFFMRRVTMTAVLNVVLNLILIPLYGRDAAAINTLVSELLGFVLMTQGINKILGGIEPEWSRLGRMVVATCPAVLALVLVPSSTLVWLRIVMGAAIYVVGAVVFGAVGREELRSLLSRERAPAAVEVPNATN